MKLLKNVLIAAVLGTLATTAQSAPLDLDSGELTLSQGDHYGNFGKSSLWGKGWEGRTDFGYGGDGGGNLEAYSKLHGTNPGNFHFVYGGGASTGRIKFIHYNGSGWTEKMRLDTSGNLYVSGTVNASSVVVQTQDINSWPDYVFEDDYKLMSLDALEAFIDANGHLPDVASKDDVAREGVNVGQMSATLLRKVEELTLYVIDMKKENEALKRQISEIR